MEGEFLWVATSEDYAFQKGNYLGRLPRRLRRHPFYQKGNFLVDNAYLLSQTQKHFVYLEHLSMEGTNAGTWKTLNTS